MNERSVFHLISELTKSEGVSCVLIGGFAVNSYKVTRQTVDVDFLITQEAFKKIIPHLRKAGYKKREDHKNFFQLKSSQPTLMDVDFIFVDQETLTKILSEAHAIKIAKQKFMVPSLEHLIALKLHAIKHNPKLRLTKDLPDIINLIRINDLNYKNTKFKKLCLKFGPDDIYNKILEALA